MWRRKSRTSRIVLIASIAGSACGPEVSPEWKSGSPRSSESRGAFFPAGSLNERGDSDSFEREWYSKHLAAAGEFALPSAKLEDAYRFTFLPSFSHPVVVRVERNSDSAIIVAKELDGVGGYDPGELIVDRYRSLTRSEWEEIERRVVAMQFWALPKHACEGRDHPDDGAVWLLEGVSHGEYAAVQWHWDECAACLDLVELAELKLQGLGPEPQPLPPLPPPPPSFFEWFFQ